ncbi:phosphoglucomutase (alpha-D-glucose-1,6-bisphosphate-dependent) [Calditerrivibrio nitroreducens]|uniref:Phosphoglucomutase, alpha-D-glucose phosphate-specific n=1 Tax=Calditerrivibrio nitroreducens (strain DSM 19672 / NBRC 101217 / Yu37-1) TaxID=768670 RepID=E4THE9_CALNY|nr:phosphoglucomutase (alpha-D-glucose-1,6-bisphosphate-dependent) [Calditerrivibrio nitroreducens]ADR19884.1 phosphoglucomutase, alpha-D-glucose phosphate-specific [Calditerrivibrio nitroreducens DSM 19672]
MSLHPLAGKPAPKDILTNIPNLVSYYYINEPDLENPVNKVVFGTSGHRGTSLNGSFNEDHIAAITQAICNYRKLKGIKGPLFIGKDTHALSEPAFITAIEVLVGNGITVMVSEGTPWTPTPAVSYAILKFNRNNKVLADGIVITPSHNPPEDGGFKYNPPSGGPADTDVTSWLEKEANRIMEKDLNDIKWEHFAHAIKSSQIKRYNFMKEYVDDLIYVLNIEKISSSGMKIAADSLGGSGLDYYGYIAEKYKLNIDLYNNFYDPTFSFMTVDKDGKIRMDCSSPYAMAGLIKLKDNYDIAFGSDPDFDRHGIVTKTGGLMNPNHYLSVAAWYLFNTRVDWNKDAAIGKTLVSSAMIDKVASIINRKVYEVPVGFKWFVNGLLRCTLGFGGEESAGGSFLRKDGLPWSTDKDGIIMSLLSAEILVETGKDPYEHYRSFEDRFGKAYYTRLDIPSTPEEKEKIKKLSKDLFKSDEIAGDKILAVLNKAPGNDASIGGVKVVTENGWFAARPSGTEQIYKIYAESFKDEEHLNQLIEEAKLLIKNL